MNRPIPKLLIVDDDPDAGGLLQETLIDHFRVDRTVIVECVADAMQQDFSAIDLVLCDINLPDGSGLELLESMLKQRADLPVIMVTSESDLSVAMTAIQRGAYDYIVKTGDYWDTVPLFVEKNLEVWRIKQHNAQLQAQLEKTLEQVRVKNQQLEEAVAQLQTLASTDALTGLANRRSINDSLERAFAEAQRYGSDLAAAMIDLDRFKAINDTLGHQTGDKLLATAARVLQANCRRSDVAGRYGGDEFVLLLPRTDPKTAKQVALRIRDQFTQAAGAMLPEGHATSMSVGLACMSVHRPATADQLIALADAALYRSKAGSTTDVELGPPSSASDHPARTTEPRSQT